MAGLRRALADHADDVLLFGGLALATLGGTVGSEVLAGLGVVVLLASIPLSESLADLLAPPETAGTRATEDADDPVAVLRERYASGEIDETEFERRLERLLATEGGPAGRRPGTDAVGADPDRARETAERDG